MSSNNDQFYQSVYIVRHGIREDFERPEWKYEHPDHPHDPPLSKAGLEQATETGRHLKNANITHIFASPYIRTIQTAMQISIHATEGKVPIKLERGFMEWFAPDANFNLKEIEPRPLSELKQLYPEFNIDESYRSRLDPLPHAGETEEEVAARCKRAVELVTTEFEGKGNLVIVGHAASVIVIARGLLHREHPKQDAISNNNNNNNNNNGNDEESQLPPAEPASPVRIRAGVCSITQIAKKERNGEWHLIRNGDTSHLQHGEQYHWDFEIEKERQRARLLLQEQKQE